VCPSTPAAGASHAGSPKFLCLLISIVMIPTNNFCGTIFYPITYILSSFSIDHIPSRLDSRVDIVSDLDSVSIIFTLSLVNNYLATSAKRLGDSIINVHRNYGDFCIGSALTLRLE
jgi:hypothetical protein